MAQNVANGTQTATVSTEHTLNDQSGVAGDYQLWVNLTNLANGDVVELRVYGKVLSADAYGVIWFAVYSDAVGADSEIVVSPPVMCVNGAKFTLKQTAGTGRSFKWNVSKP